MQWFNAVDQDRSGQIDAKVRKTYLRVILHLPIKFNLLPISPARSFDSWIPIRPAKSKGKFEIPFFY